MSINKWNNMPIVRTLSEKESKEDTKFGIDITEFYLEYRYKGVDYCIFKEDLKDFFSIYILGMNYDDRKENKENF